MLVNNKKIELELMNEETITLSKINDDFIILDDNTYTNQEHINIIAEMIKNKKYKVNILKLNKLLKELKTYLEKTNLKLENYTIVTVGTGGKQTLEALKINKLNVIPVKWSRNWNGSNSNQFITDIDNYNFKNKKIVIVEDVIATGETLFNIILEIEKRGGKVEAIIGALINESSPLIDKSFRKTIVSAKIKNTKGKDPFWYPAVYSTRHLFWGDEEMPDFYKVLNEKYFDDNSIENKIKILRGN